MKYKVIKKVVKLFVFALILISLFSCYTPPVVSSSNPVKDARSKFTHMKASTVMVVNDMGMASGVLIHQDIKYSLVLTAYHVVNERITKKIIVKTRINEKNPCEGMFIDGSEKYDIALVKVNCRLLGVPAPIALREPHDGDVAYAVGHFRFITHILTKGVVGNTKVKTYAMSKYSSFPHMWLQVSAQIAPGSSGGPIFNNNGEVIGIVSWVVTSEILSPFGLPISIPMEHMAMGVTLENIKRHLSKWKLGYLLPGGDIGQKR
jgi:S1-C subfamily serine protease